MLAAVQKGLQEIRVDGKEPSIMYLIMILELAIRRWVRRQQENPADSSKEDQGVQPDLRPL